MPRLILEHDGSIRESASGSILDRHPHPATRNALTGRFWRSQICFRGRMNPALQWGLRIGHRARRRHDGQAFGQEQTSGRLRPPIW